MRKVVLAAACGAVAGVACFVALYLALTLPHIHESNYSQWPLGLLFAAPLGAVYGAAVGAAIALCRQTRIR